MVDVEIDPTKVGRLPNLVVIGAQKCGTTSLHYNLKLHPQIFMSKMKEVQFFNRNRAWEQGPDWYRRHFKTALPVAGESSPNYSFYNENIPCAERMAQVIPNAKLIYLVRDPIDRIASQYSHYQSLIGEDRSFEDAVFGFTYGYLARSRYFFQLEKFLKFYRDDQVLVLSSSDMFASQAETMAEIFRFLGVDDKFESTQFNRRLNQSSEKRILSRPQRQVLRLGKKLEKRIPLFGGRLRRLAQIPWPLSTKPVVKPVITDEMRARLVQELLPDITKLREFTGKSFSDWSL